MLTRETNQMKADLASIQPGGKIKYHEGNLAYDRDLPSKESHNIDEVASFVWRLVEDKKVTCVQQRIRRGVTAYYAVGLAKRKAFI